MNRFTSSFFSYDSIFYLFNFSSIANNILLELPFGMLVLIAFMQSPLKPLILAYLFQRDLNILLNIELNSNIVYVDREGSGESE